MKKKTAAPTPLPSDKKPTEGHVELETGTLDPEIAAIKEPKKISEENRSNWRKLQQTADRYKKEVEELKKSLNETQRRLEPFLHLESSSDILSTTPPQTIAMLAATLCRENMSSEACIQKAREFLQLAAEKPAVDISKPDWSEFDKGAELSENLSFEKQLSKMFPRNKADIKKKNLKVWLQSNWSHFLEIPDEQEIGRFTLALAPLCKDETAAENLMKEWENVGTIPHEVFEFFFKTKEEGISQMRQEVGKKGGNAKAKKAKQGRVVSEETDGRFGSRRVDPEIENDPHYGMPHMQLLNVLKSDKKTR
jgi:hypothetical protein